MTVTTEAETILVDRNYLDSLIRERDRLKKQNAAYGVLTKSQEAQLSVLRAKQEEYRESVAMLDSERAANEQLTQERDRLKGEVDECKKYALRLANHLEMFSRL